VNIHQHARLTPFGRACLIQRLEAGEKPAEAARTLRISVRTAYKWWTRWKTEGEAGLRDRSSRPHRCPRRLATQKVQEIEQLRRARWSSPRIARRLALPVSTVVITLRRLGLAKLSALEPPREVVRYERAAAGEMVHLDTKKLGRVGHVGHRIHGDHSRRLRGIGWEWLHVAVDDATRLAYTEILPDEKKERCSEFLLRASAWFQSQGVPLQRVMTDNGSGYCSHLFRRAVEQLQVRHVRTRPYRPQTNGKAERFIQTCLREWAYANAYSSSGQRTLALESFQRYYNQERPHLGIRGRSPQQRLRELVVNNLLVNDN
jgi:transposase InsO family protein